MVARDSFEIISNSAATTTDGYKDAAKRAVTSIHKAAELRSSLNESTGEGGRLRYLVHTRQDAVRKDIFGYFRATG